MSEGSLVETLEEQFIAAFPHLPTPGQGELIHAFARFVFSGKPRCGLIVRGYAGTGKTTSIGALVRVLTEWNVPVVLLAPTGRAAKVIQAYAGLEASTIHRAIYFPAKTRDGSPGQTLAPNLRRRAVFIVDEASMIGEGGVRGGGDFEYRSLLDDLMEYVFSGEGCRLVLVGDDAQLPPVGAEESPALQLTRLQREFALTAASVRLTDVVRQELDSAILLNAHHLRLQLDADQTGFPHLHPGRGLIRLGGEDLQETLEDLYGRFGEEGVVVITRSNKRANLFNQQIRTRILWQEDDLTGGDRLMVVRNNYHWLAGNDQIPSTLIANGDTLEVVRIVRRFERYGAQFADAEVRMPDLPDHDPFEVTIHLTLLHSDLPSIPFAEMQALFEAIAEDHIDLGSKARIRRAVQADPCYQALQVKFAWSLTCHKAQGGQWPAVVVDQGYLTEEMLDRSLLRWFYTAFTRAQEELYLLNFSDEFFEQGETRGKD
jgi:exodeoxyribonuclease-5